MFFVLVIAFLSFLLSVTSHGQVKYEWVIERDLGQEEEIYVKAFCKAYENLSNEALGLKSDDNRALWLQNACRDRTNTLVCIKNNMHVLHARSGEKILGFAVFEETGDKDEVYIVALCVDPAYHRCGIGESLVFKIGQLFPETKKLVLMTRKLNVQARDFYIKKCGFKECDYVHEGLSSEYYIGYEWQGDVQKKLEEISLKNVAAGIEKIIGKFEPGS